MKDIEKDPEYSSIELFLDGERGGEWGGAPAGGKGY
jgi:hypothetical protein